MAVNLIVITVTFLLMGFIVVWLGWPSCRPGLEAPKFPPARWDEAPATSRRSLCSGNLASDPGPAPRPVRDRNL